MDHVPSCGWIVACSSLYQIFAQKRKPSVAKNSNKSERFNQFLQWIAFGGGALAAEGIRDEQRKFIKYNHLVANLLIFHNVVTMSNALERLVAEGYALDADLIACSSPYLTGHLNRFGRYALNRDRVPEPLDSVREFKMPPRGEKPLRTAQVAV